MAATSPAAIYAVLTYSTVRILTGSHEQASQSQKAKHTTAVVFDWPAGRWLVGLAGIAVVGARGLEPLPRGHPELREGAARGRGAERTWGRRVGVAGHLARALVAGLVGIFVIKAAVEYDPKEAIGFDGALQKLANAPYGPYLLGITAVGLLCSRSTAWSTRATATSRRIRAGRLSGFRTCFELVIVEPSAVAT